MKAKKDKRNISTLLNEWGIEEDTKIEINEQIFAIGAGGLRKLETGIVTLQPNTIYHLGASSDPKQIAITKVEKDRFWYKAYPFMGQDIVIDRASGEDLLVRGMKTWMKIYKGANYPWVKKRIKSYEAMLAGKPGMKEDITQYHYVTIYAKLADPNPDDPTGSKNSKGQDMWYEAEKYGGVALAKDGTFIIEGSVRDGEEIKKNKNFKVIKIEKRKVG